MSIDILQPTSIGDDDYTHWDADFRTPTLEEVEPQNGPGGICEAELDPVSIIKTGSLDPDSNDHLFIEQPSEKLEDLLEEIQNYKNLN